MPRKLRNYTLFPLARADLQEIWRYTLKTWSAAQADTYHRKFVSAFESLAAGTREGRKVDRIRQGYFRLAVGSHFIFYRIFHRESGEEIEIVRVLHQRRDIEMHL